jgi:hypothetical protein
MGAPRHRRVHRTQVDRLELRWAGSAPACRRCRSSALRTFPVAVRGKESTISRRSGVSCRAVPAVEKCARMSVSDRAVRGAARCRSGGVDQQAHVVRRNVWWRGQRFVTVQKLRPAEVSRRAESPMTTTDARSGRCRYGAGLPGSFAGTAPTSSAAACATTPSTELGTWTATASPGITPSGGVPPRSDLPGRRARRVSALRCARRCERRREGRVGQSTPRMASGSVRFP